MTSHSQSAGVDPRIESEADANDLALALLHGEDVTMQAADLLRRLIDGLERWAPPASDAGILLATLAAARPDVLGPPIADALGKVLARADLKHVWQPEVDEAFEMLHLLIPTPAANAVAKIVVDSLHTPSLHPRWAKRCFALLVRLIDFDPARVDVEALLELGAELGYADRLTLLRSVIGPRLLANPSTITVNQLRRVREIASEPEQARFLLAALAEHLGAFGAVREAAQLPLDDLFSIRQRWREVLKTDTPRIVCIQNIADGQGDEIVRVVPILQAFLDGFPEAQITLITDRAYLYRHSRLTTISFDDRSGLAQALITPHDILVEFSERIQRHLNHDPNLIEAIDFRRVQRPPNVDIVASKGWNHFTFEHVMIGGIDWAEALQLNRTGDLGVYEPTSRLIAELGLPLRVGEQTSRSDTLLDSGEPWIEECWRDATSANRDHRPVAVLNPFGGSEPMKGFIRRKWADLAGLIGQLIDEGFFVLVCSNGQPWGSATAVADIIQQLGSGTSHCVGQMPEPIDLENHESIRAHPRNPGERIQMLLGFVARADLTVTVEGWMMHSTFLLGRPYRLLTMPVSIPSDWQPWGRSVNQRRWAFSSDSALDRVPLPEQPRKEAWLAMLSRVNDVRWKSALLLIAKSEDPEIRAAAIRALSQLDGGGSVPTLITWLEDPSHLVRGAAAAALLEHHQDIVGVGTVPDMATLQVYRITGSATPDWHRISEMGPSALVALRSLLHVEDPVARREAAIHFEMISRTASGLSVVPEYRESAKNSAKSIESDGS